MRRGRRTYHFQTNHGDHRGEVSKHITVFVVNRVKKVL